MADIELVIKIPEVIMAYIKRNRCLLVYTDEVANAILDGTPLPKGHGDLIDRKELRKNAYTAEEVMLGAKQVVDTQDIDDAPTIIETDKESE